LHSTGKNKPVIFAADLNVRAYLELDLANAECQSRQNGFTDE